MDERHRTHDSPRGRLAHLGVPLARWILHRSPIVPTGEARWLFRAALEIDALSRDIGEWARRTFVATPMLLARCAVHGDDITVDEPPCIGGKCRIEIGSDVRISGRLEVQSGAHAGPVLKIGAGTSIGRDCVFGVASRVEIGDYVSIGACTFISDTAEHGHQLLDQPTWKVRDEPGDAEGVTIEDNVQIGRGCVILKGVRIGARSLIGAGSVVRSDVQPDAIVAGNPARVVGWRRALARPAAASKVAPEESANDRAPESSKEVIIAATRRPARVA
jgi:acetyltransferase-like isoleucine patch superfamily enzyme